MQTRDKIVPLIILCILLYVVFFLDLSSYPLRIWDESRQAVSAFEMSYNGNLLVTHYENLPDMWNLKPPLLVWIQCGLIKIIGPSELAIRLPNAIAGFLTAMMFVVFTWKYYGRFWLGFIAAVVLTTCRGYIDFHGGRSGDYDSLLTFLTVFYALNFFLYFEKEKLKYLYLAMVGLILAVMTKGIAGLFFIPAIAVSAIIFRKVRLILSNKHFYFMVFMLLFIVCGFYLLREHYNPGYLKAVIVNELGGRFNAVIEQHDGPFYFYLENIYKIHLIPWALFIPCGFIAGILDTDKKFTRMIWYLTGVTVWFWLLLSLSATKISWYIYQVIPFLSLLIAVFLHYVFTVIEKIELKGVLRHKILPYAFLLITFYTPYHEMFHTIYLHDENAWEVQFYQTSYYLRDIIKKRIELNEPLKVSFDGFTYHMIFYKEILNRNGKSVAFTPKEKLQIGDLVVCSQDSVNKYIQDHYTFDPIENWHHVSLFRITGLRSL